MVLAKRKKNILSCNLYILLRPFILNYLSINHVVLNSIVYIEYNVLNRCRMNCDYKHRNIRPVRIGI